MTRPAVTQEQPSRGSCWGADGVYYPAWEERTVPLSERAPRLIFYLYMALNRVFARRPDVYVGADQFLYWVPGDISQRVAPDVYVIFGVPKEPPRSVIRTWEEAAPAFVVEVSSAESRRQDQGRKLALYRDVLRIPEYLIYDEEREELILHRLEEGRYVRQEPDAQGRYYSRELGVWFGPDPVVTVRVFGPDARAIPGPEELFQERDDLQEHRDFLARIAQRFEAELEDLRRRHEAAAARMQEQLEAERRLREEQGRQLEAERRLREEQERVAEAERRRAALLEAELRRLKGEPGD